MNPLQLLESIQRIEQPSKEDLVKIIKLHKAFPYFQIPKVLLARYEHDKSSGDSDMLHHAAIVSPDRMWLKNLVENKESINEIIRQFNPGLQKAIEEKGPQNPDNLIDDLDDNLIPKPAKKENPKERTQLLKKLGEDLGQAKISENTGIIDKKEEPVQETVELKPEIEKVASVTEDKKEGPLPAEAAETKKPVAKKKRKGKGDELIESIKKRDKVEIQDEKKKEQIDIIKAFSKREIKLATLKEMESQSKQDDLSEKSTKLNPALITESYANLLVKQGKKQKAKEIYKKLMVKFPDKSTYFADLIKELEENKS